MTLDGSVIHKSGLITGGQGSNQQRPRWKDGDIDGNPGIPIIFGLSLTNFFLGLMRARDKLLAELNELNKRKRMGSAEEVAKSGCAGLEAQLGVLRDELVRSRLFFG